MILSEYVEVKLTKRTYNKLVKKYSLNNKIKVGDIAKIPISILSKSSHYEIDLTCDYCSKLLKVPYKRYTLSTRIVNKYACSDKECSNKKIKDVCQVKYGVDNPFQSEKVKTKIKETLNEKYGVDHPMFLYQTKEKIKETCLVKYGVSSYTKTVEYMEKTIKTNMEKYGVEYSLQSAEVRDKGKKTNMERYGVEYSQQSKEVKEKTIKTNLEKYGVECNLQSEEIKENIKKTNIKKYGVDNPMKSDIIRKKYYNISNDEKYLKYLNSKISKFICNKGHEFELSSVNYISRKKIDTPLCTICNPISDSQSIKEKDLCDYIKSIYDGKIIRSYRDGLEIDIYLPDLKIGFEFNGLYWHSEEYKDKNYHLSKTNHFKEKGIRIIHIWEDNWTYKRDIIESQIANWLGLTKNKIFARNCQVKKIVDSKEVNKFLDENHIQGRVVSCLKLGLFYKNKMVSLMTFDHNEGRKKMEEGGWNLSRFCNKLEFNVIGGFSKLFLYFIENYDIKRVISYSDNDWSLGHVYERLGFVKVIESKPDYKYILENMRINKSNFRKSKLKTDITESEYMKKSQIYKIWDCGKTKWQFTFPYQQLSV